MSLTVPRLYSALAVLTKVQLDAAFDSLETKFNTTLIAGSEIQAFTIEAGNIASNAVTTVKINDLAVTTAKLNDDAVTAAKLADNAVVTANITDLSVTTAKIAANGVTRAKLEAVGQQVSSSCDVFSTTSTAHVDVTNLSVTITTTGRPVFVAMVHDGNATNAGNIRTGSVYSSGSYVELQVLRGATVVSLLQGSVTNSAGNSTSQFFSVPPCIDSVAAGTYTYKVQVRNPGAGGGNVQVNYWKLVAYEL